MEDMGYIVYCSGEFGDPLCIAHIQILVSVTDINDSEDVALFRHIPYPADTCILTKLFKR